MNDEEAPETRWIGLPLRCPHCGNNGADDGKWTTNASVPFKLVEDVIRSFEFRAALEKGRLSLVADVETDRVDWESGSNQRIECMSCFGDFPVPADADVDFLIDSPCPSSADSSAS